MKTTNKQEYSAEKEFPSDIAFRLLYNGRVLTSKMRECRPHEGLCNISFLLNKIVPAADLSRRNCTSSLSSSSEVEGEGEEEAVGGYSRMRDEAEAAVTTKGGMLTTAAALVSGMALGGIGTYLLVLLGTIPGLCRCCRHRCGRGGSIIPRDDDIDGKEENWDGSVSGAYSIGGGDLGLREDEEDEEDSLSSHRCIT